MFWLNTWRPWHSNTRHSTTLAPNNWCRCHAYSENWGVHTEASMHDGMKDISELFLLLTEQRCTAGTWSINNSSRMNTRQEVLHFFKSTLLGCAHLCNGTKILESWAPIWDFLPRKFVASAWPTGDLHSRNDANVGSQKYFKSKVNTTFIPVFKLKDTQQKDASIQTSSVVTSLSKTNLSTPTSDQSTNVPTKHGLSGLLLDLSQISPSLNKYKGVLGRQWHFASRERQA